jgi:dolichol kinase
MFALFFVLVGIAVLIMAGEYLRRVHLFQAEVTRKFIHITVAAFAASWPFYLEWNQIYLISMLMLTGVIFSRTMHLFGAIHGVKRRTWGELFYAMGIGIAAVLGQNEWAFAAAMLVMGVADGFAALVGTLLDNTHRYKILGHYKSREGTITFFVATLAILLICGAIGHFPLSVAGVFALALAATLTENISVAGTDNLFVPLIIVIIL